MDPNAARLAGRGLRVIGDHAMLRHDRGSREAIVRCTRVKEPRRHVTLRSVTGIVAVAAPALEIGATGDLEVARPGGVGRPR